MLVKGKVLNFIYPRQQACSEQVCFSKLIPYCVNIFSVRYIHVYTHTQRCKCHATGQCCIRYKPSLPVKLNKIPQWNFTKVLTEQNNKIQRKRLTEVWQHCYFQPFCEVDGGIIELQQLIQLGFLARSLHGSAEADRDGRHQRSQGLNQQYSHNFMGVLENLVSEKLLAKANYLRGT